MIPGIFFNWRIRKRVANEALVKTPIDTLISFVWKGYMIAWAILLIIIFSLGFGTRMYDLFFLINPVILTMIGLAEFVTAKACRFKPYLYGSFIMWAGALACTAVFWLSKEPVIMQLFVLAVCMFAGFVIPGYKLNKSAKENV
jgi:hypothetical protein